MILFFHATLWNTGETRQPESSIIIDAMDEKQAKQRIKFLNERLGPELRYEFDGPFPIDRTIVIDEVLAYEIANTWWIGLMFTPGMKNWAAELIAKRSQRKWFKYVKFKGIPVINEPKEIPLSDAERSRIEKEYRERHPNDSLKVVK